MTIVNSGFEGLKHQYIFVQNLQLEIIINVLFRTIFTIIVQRSTLDIKKVGPRGVRLTLNPFTAKLFNWNFHPL